MKIIRGTSATTRPDRHGDQFTIEALVKHADDANKFYYPLGLNHDPRLPPVGRIVRSFVAPQDDGHAALMFEAQQFEEGDTIDLSSASRRLAPNLLRAESEIIYDNSFEDSETVKALSRLASALGLRTRKQTKKAFDPLSVLILVTGLTAAGFFAPLGADLNALLKNSLAALLKRRANQTKVLVLRFKLVRDRREIQAEIFLTNPTVNHVQAVIDTKAAEIERIFIPLCSQTEVVKVVAEFSSGALVPKFALRTDGVPFDSSGRLIAHKGILPSGFSISFQDEKVEDTSSAARGKRRRSAPK